MNNPKKDKLPKKEETQKRKDGLPKKDSLITIRFTEEQKERLDHIAEKMNSTVPAICRHLCEAVIDYCGEDQRMALPIRITSPLYTIQNGKLVDETPAMAAEDPPAKKKKK